MVRQKFILVLLIALLMGLYFFGHNSGESRLYLLNGLQMLGRMALDLGAVALLIGLAGGIGRRVLFIFDFSEISRLERVAIESSSGLGVISLIALIMGLLGFFNWWIWLLVVAFAIYSFRSLIAWIGDIRAIVKDGMRQNNPWERFLAGFIIVACLAALLLALAPPHAWDAMAYHLVIPQRYIEEGTIRQHLDIHFFGFPQGLEMLYGMLMMITGANRAPAVLHFAIGILGLLATWGLVRRYSSTKAAYTSVLLLLASFNLWQLFGWPYVDLALMTYSLIALIAIAEWGKANYETGKWLGLAGLAGGLAAAVKYTAFPLLLALAIFILLRKPKQAIRNILIFGVIGFIVFLPWLIKGFLLYENPVYPYLFDGPNWDDVRSMNFSETDGKGLWDSGAIFQAQIPLLPLAATIFGLDKVTPYRFTTGPFLFLLPFVLLLGWNRLPDESRKLAKDIIALVLIVLGFWMLIASFSGIGGQTRLMMVSLPMTAILGALAYHSVENWPRRPIDIVFILQATLLIALFLGIFDYLNYFAKSRVLEYQIGAISEDEYLLENLGSNYEASLALRDLPPDSTVQFLWEPKTYYCPANLTCIGDLLFDVWARPIRLGASPEELLAEWRNAGVDYFLLQDLQGENPEGYSRWLDYHGFAYEQNVLFAQYFFPAVEEVWTDGYAYTIYRWKE